MKQVPSHARVLVADDAAALRTVVRITVESQGWTALEATSGDEAVAIATSQRPDLILLDLDFGAAGPDGFTVLADLRASAETAVIPVVILTASLRENDEARARAAGAVAFLAKPFGPLDLIETLREALGAAAVRAPLGLHLVQDGALTAPQLQRALEQQRQREREGSPIPLGTLLTEAGAISSAELTKAVEGQDRRPATRGESAGRSATVLVVDDHPAARDGLRALLESESRLHLIAEAASGAEGLALAQALRPDLVVLDHEMPGMLGLEVLRELRGALPRTQVVMYTMSRHITAEAEALGAAAVVSKDDVQALLATLRRIAEARPATQVTPPARQPARVARIRPESLGIPRRQIEVLLIALIGYGFAFLVAEPVLGPSAAVLGVVSVALAGALLGPALGVLEAILINLATQALWSFTGHQAGETLFMIGGNGFGAVTLLVLGAAFGGMRLNASRGRRIETLLGEAIAGDATPASVVAAAQKVLSAQSVVLFRLSADWTQLEIVGTRGLDQEPPAIAVRDVPALGRAIREMRPVVNGDPRDAEAVVANARSSAFVPVALPGAPTVGVLALFDRRTSQFTKADLRLLLALAIPAAIALTTPVAPARGVVRPTVR